MIANASVNLGLVIPIQNLRADGAVTGNNTLPDTKSSVCVCVCGFFVCLYVCMCMYFVKHVAQARFKLYTCLPPLPKY